MTVATPPRPQDKITPERSASPPKRPYARLKAYVVSDVHLNNHPYDPQEPENPRRRNFRMFLTQIGDAMLPNDKVLLVLNGDILDITGSWYESVMPWDMDAKAVEKHLSRLLVEIMENNVSAFDELRRLLRNPMTEIIYVYGNHDWLLQRFPASHEIIRTFIAPQLADQARIRFAENFKSEELELYVEHGHRLDPFNYAEDRHAVGKQPEKAQPPLGDVINVLIVNRFVELVLERMRMEGFSDGFIAKMQNRLHDIEYLRPLSLLPLWIRNTSTRYQQYSENAGRARGIEVLLQESVSDILHDPDMMRYLVRQLRLPPGFLLLAINTAMRIPASMPLMSFLTSLFVRKTHSNKPQYQAARRLHHVYGYRLIAFGHTHIPSVQPLSRSAYYFNTGSWKPVINLFKHTKELPPEVEYLNPDIQFNKVERCGILHIEKTDFSIGAPAQFMLQTIQSGLS